MNTWALHRKWHYSAFCAAFTLLAPGARGQSAQEDLPALPSEPESTPSTASPSESGEPRLPPYMVEEPFVPPAADDAEYGAPESATSPGHYAYPNGYILEPPPPPPPPPHRAPRTSLWLGARLGMIAPFGKLDYDYPDGFSGPSWADVAGPGVSAELNFGGRFERRYIVYALWERGSLGLGRDHDFMGAGRAQKRARTDLFGVGFRWTSHPDQTGFVVDFGLGFRTFRADWEGDVSLHLVSPIEVRLGLGADIRISRTFTLSPMLQISNGSFMSMRLEQPGAPSKSLLQYEAPHGTFGLAIGGHFDLLPSP